MLFIALKSINICCSVALCCFVAVLPTNYLDLTGDVVQVRSPPINPSGRLQTRGFKDNDGCMVTMLKVDDDEVNMGMAIPDMEFSCSAPC